MRGQDGLRDDIVAALVELLPTAIYSDGTIKIVAEPIADAVLDKVQARIDAARELALEVHAEHCDGLKDELNAAVANLTQAENEHAEFLEELDVAFGLEDGEESRYSNPEGAAEAIYVDVAAGFRRERDAAVARAEAAEQAVARVRELAELWVTFAPEDEWGKDVLQTILSDAGRDILRALDDPS